MTKHIFTFGIILTGFGSLMLFSSFNGQQAPAEERIVPSNSLRQYISAYDLDQPFSLAGEAIPDDNFDALERLDRELVINAYLHSATLLNIKLANRYFPVIEPILKKHGVPDDFKYLCVAESNLRMATSPAGAKGLWQFLESVGRSYGLEINSEVDERYHVEKSTEAACKFILHLKKRFGSWTLAAAAYNMGETMLNRRIQDQQAKTFYDLHLNEETSRYVFRIIAIKEIMEDPGQFGFFVEQDQLYPPLEETYTLPVDGPVPDLADLAVNNGTSYRMLKVLNPWLISTSLTNKTGKQYEIRLPKK